MVCAGQCHRTGRDGLFLARSRGLLMCSRCAIVWQRCFNWRVMGDVLLVVDCGSAVTRAVLAWPDGHLAGVAFGAAEWLPSGVYLGADDAVITGAQGQQAARDDPSRYVADPVRWLGRPSITV